MNLPQYMKNKKAEQAANRERHKVALKSGRRSEPALQRAVPLKLEKPTFLIVCEGENTEPSYFSQFRLSSATIRSIGEGYNTLSLVNRTLQLAKEKNYEQVWCVFDKDDFRPLDFNNAIVMARASGLGVAYSNQAFEYWILLHFIDHQGGGMHRTDYDGRINQLLQPFKIRYDGKGCKKITEDIFETLFGMDPTTKMSRTQLAISRAKRNYAKLDPSNQAMQESSTTVFELVEELLKYV
jgi:hypothetical protein